MEAACATAIRRLCPQTLRGGSGLKIEVFFPERELKAVEIAKLSERVVHDPAAMKTTRAGSSIPCLAPAGKN